MEKIKNSRENQFKLMNFKTLLYLLPLVLLVFVIQSCKESDVERDGSMNRTTSVFSAVQTQSVDQVFLGAEVMPEYPGGQAEIYKFLSQEIQYPMPAMRANVSGKVTVQFVVEEDGSMGEVKVLKPMGFGLDEEAVRVVKKLTDEKKFSPGMQNGQAVKVWYTLPVNFSLEG